MRHSVVMLETVFAAEDGINPKRYIKGRRYSIADHLCQQFMAMKAIKLNTPTYEAPCGAEF